MRTWQACRSLWCSALSCGPVGFDDAELTVRVTGDLVGARVTLDTPAVIAGDLHHQHVIAGVTGIWQKAERIVFVDFKGKQLGQMPEFYVLTVKQWLGVLKKIQKRHRDKGENCSIDPKTNTLVWAPWKGHPKGWTGCVIRSDEIAAFKDKWSKP